MYKIQSALILAGLVATFGFISLIALGPLAAILIVGTAFVFNLGSRTTAARMILKAHRARPLRYEEWPWFHRMTGELAVRASVDLPHLAIYPSDIPNAFALSASRNEGVIAVSTALTQLLDRNEIRGVVAHEIAHLKNRDSSLSVSAGLFAQGVATVASVFGIMLLLLALGGVVSAGLLTTALIVIVAPNVAHLLQAGLMRTRERLADRDAALLTGDPRGLASALAKLERYNRYLAGLARRFRFIYTTGGHEERPWQRTHPPTEERIQNLLEMENRILPIAGHPRYKQVG